MHIYLHTDQVKNHQKRQIMYKYSKDGISVLSVLDARRAKKSGLFPVKIQVIHNRRQKYYSTGQELSKEDWANLAESKSRRLTEARSNIENSFSIIKGQVEALAERGDFAFDLLSVRLGRCSTATVNAAIKAKTEELKRNGQAGTYRSYHALLTAVEEFAGKDIPFSAVTVDWLNPWLGQGSGYHFSWYIPGGATIHSIDNFYVANYIRYGYPGLVVYGLLILQAVGEMVRCGIQKKDRTMLCLALAVCGYFLNLWWMDTLQTIKYAYLPIALFQVISREKWENMSDLQHKAVHRYIR